MSTISTSTVPGAPSHSAARLEVVNPATEQVWGSDPDADGAREEIFGPVVSVLSYGTVDEAVEIANGTGYGLGGIVFSADPRLRWR